MKTTLFASTALVLSVGAAAAADFTMADTGHDHSITLSGDARMGIIHHRVDDGATTSPVTEYITEFTSRARVKFTAAGETDGGLGFGFNFRADNAGTARDRNNNGTLEDDEVSAGGAVSGQAGSVFISQGGHKLAMGDVDSAAKAAVGNVSGVGLTGLGDYNEMNYELHDNNPALLYSYAGGALSFHLSLDNHEGVAGDAIGNGVGLGVAYDAGTFNVALGYEMDDDGEDSTYLGAGIDIGAVGLHAIVADHGANGDDYAISADFTTGATTFTIFVADDDGQGAVGLGASHDLGGGAKIVAGVVDADDEDEVIWDLGVAMTF